MGREEVALLLRCVPPRCCRSAFETPGLCRAFKHTFRLVIALRATQPNRTITRRIPRSTMVVPTLAGVASTTSVSVKGGPHKIRYVPRRDDVPKDPLIWLCG